MKSAFLLTIFLACLWAAVFAIPLGIVPASGADPRILDLISKVSQDSQRDFVTTLTTKFQTRQSNSAGALEAKDYLSNLLSEFGYEVEVMQFKDDYTPNVIAELKGSTHPEKIVIVGCHYDDRASGLYDSASRAPGANDDGSGVGAVLELARVFASAGVQFEYTLRLCFFAGEEQGLYGSKAYAARAADLNEDIVAMLQADMVAYLAPGQSLKLEMASRYSTPDLLDLAVDSTKLYVPELETGLTNSCCSDHQPFYELGFPATAYNEPGGYTIDPQYHKVGDVSDREGYSFELLSLITQSVGAAVCVLARLL